MPTNATPFCCFFVTFLLLVTAATNAHSQTSPGQSVQTNASETYDLLDQTISITRKQLLLLFRNRNTTSSANELTLGSAVSAVANVQKSNRAGKFGYLMRHPTSNNQVGNSTSEAVLHSAHLRVTGTASTWITGHMELLYDPQQSFGKGTITALARNQIQLRRGFLLLGNLDKSPVYASLGKTAVPFGLMDTVSPFTASTVWHAFGALAYGARVGFERNGLGISFMGIQGGAQFRAAHTPVRGTAIPSQTNNFAMDVNYTVNNGDPANQLLIGSSFIRGSAYCQEFPVQHFLSCEAATPAYDFYIQSHLGQLTLQGEFAKTTEIWPGTLNPALPEFPAHKVSSFSVGGKYRELLGSKAVDVSTEFSRFTAGPTGAPWDNQDQLVLGIAVFVTPTVKFFSEYINVAGYAPLNFISGGGGPDISGEDDTETHSDNTARSHIGLFGITAAF